METDTKTLQDLIMGLEGNLKILRINKEVFVRAQGMDIEAEKLKDEAQKIGDEVSALKTVIKELQAKKSAAIAPVIEGMSKAMNAFLPTGSAVLGVNEDGTFSICWGGVAYPGLSGGEKIMFDVALAKALGAKILCCEAAEVDGDNLQKILERYEASDIEQVIVSTCHSGIVTGEHTKEQAKSLAKWEVTVL